MAVNFEHSVQINAAKIRGAYLDMSADLEFLLVDVTCVCLLRDATERNHIKEILISHTMLSKKIEFTSKALKQFDKDLYDIAEPYLNIFRKFGETRNKLAHVRIVGDDNEIDLDVLYFVSFKKGEIVKTPHRIDDLTQRIHGYAQALNEFGTKIIPTLYEKRYLTRYNNILLFPSNRSMSHWYNLQLSQ